MPTYRCPTCAQVVTVERPRDAPHRPFCSRRCQLIDLGKWLNEEYRISEPTDIPPNTEDPLEPPLTPDSD